MGRRSPFPGLREVDLPSLYPLSALGSLLLHKVADRRCVSRSRGCNSCRSRSFSSCDTSESETPRMVVHSFLRSTLNHVSYLNILLDGETEVIFSDFISC